MLIEEVDDEISEVADTNGRLEDEIAELAEDHHELQEDGLKVGMEHNKDMNCREPAALKRNVDMEVAGRGQEPEGLLNENNHMATALLNSV